MAERFVSAEDGKAVENGRKASERSGRDPAVRNDSNKPDGMKMGLLYCGIIASVLYLLTDVIAAMFFYPGFSYVDQQVSELSAIGAPTRSIWMGMTVFWTALIVLFGIGVWRQAEKKLTLRLTAMLLMIWGIVGFIWLFFPMHQRGTVEMGTDIMHIILAAVQIIGMISFIALGAAYLKGYFGILSAGTIIAILAFGAWAGSQVSAIAAGQATPWMGLVERVSVYLPSIWVLVFSINLLTNKKREKVPLEPETGGRLDIDHAAEDSPKVSRLPLMAGGLIIFNATLLALVATWFIGIMPSLPGSTNHAVDLYRIALAGFVCGVVVLLGAMMLENRFANRKAWGTMIIVFSILGYVTGGGMLIGSILGIMGGVSAIRRKPGRQTSR